VSVLSVADGVAGDLRAALEADGGLHLVYQPKYDLFRRRITGVEALARWTHPARGPVSPATFIPAAEASGLIGPLGRLVLSEACRQAARWREDGLTLPVAVNVSSLQLGESFRGHVEQALTENELPPEALELEVTESVLMEGGSRERLDEIAELGVGVAIDDFGTGYSSLAYLKRLRAHTLKIDKSFIDGLPASLDECMLVGSIIRLAHSFGMQVVAEGVEGVDQMEVLEVLECDVVQGYGISRPIEADAVAGIVAEQFREHCRAVSPRT